MSTVAAPAVNSGLVGGGIMWRVGQIAERDGISPAAVSKTVKRLVRDHQLQVERGSGGRVTAVNVAHYDELRGKFADPSKAQTPRAEQEPSNYDKALADRTTYEAERSRLRLLVETGELVKADEIEMAMDDAGHRIARALEQVGGSVDELAAAYENGGIQQLRIKLRDLVHATREQIADILEASAAEAPETI